MEKLKVTLEDRPVDLELAQYKRMFEAACSSLAAIGDALGVDPEEGGAEPILAAIADLKAADSQPVQEPVGFVTQKLMPGFGWRKDVVFIQHVEVGTDLYAAPVQPVKQEPVIWHSVWDFVDVRRDPPEQDDEKDWLPLYAAPVDAKAIRAEALEEAAKWFEIRPGREMFGDECAAAIRGLK